MHDRMRVTTFCLTPVKNEAWILERFLACASLWADHIIIADQCSDDGSREIAARFPKVTLIDNESPAYDEGARQRLLLEAARRIPAEGKRILLALDADEALTANWCESPEWDRILAMPAGAVLSLEWVNLQPGLTKCWIQPGDVAYGFVDDGSFHEGSKIHSTRLPTPMGAPVLALRDIKLLHYQFAAWERMRSKQRWYQCWELLNHPRKRAIQIYRQYNFMYAFPQEEMRLVDKAWFEGYEQAGIDMKTINPDPHTWWDREIVGLLVKYGRERFRKLNIWDVDWHGIARAAGINTPEPLIDPRSSLDKRIHRWLAATQGCALDPKVRWLQRAMRLRGW